MKESDIVIDILVLTTALPSPNEIACHGIATTIAVRMPALRSVPDFAMYCEPYRMK